MVSLREVVERNDIPAGRRFDLFIQALIIISLVSFSVETLPDLSPEVRNALGIIEVVTVALFTAEYVLRVAVARRRLGYIFSFYGLVDLAAILPFYLATGLDLRALRILRLLRLFRAVKMVRFNQAIDRLGRSLSMVREELTLFFSAAALVLYISAVGIYHFERHVQPEQFGSVFDGLWWAVITLTTVGYGDAVPITPGGRAFTFIVLMVGLGLVAVPTGVIASALSQTREAEARGSSEPRQGGPD